MIVQLDAANVGQNLTNYSTESDISLLSKRGVDIQYVAYFMSELEQEESHFIMISLL